MRTTGCGQEVAGRRLQVRGFKLVLLGLVLFPSPVPALGEHPSRAFARCPLQHDANVSLGGTIARTPAMDVRTKLFVGSLPAHSEAVVDATLQAGANAGAKIASCYAGLPATGGTCDARGFQGAQIFSSPIQLTKPWVLLLGGATFQCPSAGCFVQAGGTSGTVRFLLQGAGIGVTTLLGAGGSSPVMNLVDAYRMRLFDLTLNGNGTQGAILQMASHAPGSTTCSGNVLERVMIQNVGAGGIGIWWNDCDNSTLRNVTLENPTGSRAPARSVGWRVDNSQSAEDSIHDSFVGYWNRGISNAETSNPGSFSLFNVTFGDNAEADIALKSLLGFSVHKAYTERSGTFLETVSPNREIAAPVIEELWVSSLATGSKYAINYTSISPLVIMGLQMPNGGALNLNAAGGYQTTTVIGLQTPFAAPHNFVLGTHNRVVKISSVEAGAGRPMEVIGEGP